MRPRGEERTAAASGAAQEEPPVELPPGPALVTVGGPVEGLAFPLTGAGPWVIGRERGVEVGLPYDPFVSKANASVERRGAGFVLVALPGARNGTSVNWRPLADDAHVPLSAGDVIRVGRSLLLVRGC